MSAESVARDPYRAPEVYYHANSSVAKYDTERLSFYATFEQAPGQAFLGRTLTVRRRGSQDSVHISTRKFYIVVEDTLRRLLEVEDTDDNGQITVDDQGPKVLFVGTAASQGWRTKDIRGTYMLSNLLQELTTAQHFGRKVIELDEARLSENPVHRLRRMIRDSFWHNLTRRIDDASIEMVAKDPKDWTSDPRPRIYVPRGAPKQYEYYQKISRTRPEIRLDVQWLREHITPEYICELNSAPGLLAIDMEEYTTKDGQKSLRGKPYVVPGGRFNELYGWDSYMIVLGLLQDDKIDLSKTMVENFCFCIQHYGKILNANRTYYLGRSQPPFLTDMTLRVYQAIKHRSEAQDFLRNGILAAIKEYRTIWTASPRLDQRTGLSRYRPEGSGVPPETEPDHFQRVLMPYAVKHGISYKEFVFKYNTGAIKEPQLDIYFLHDRATRESGHDTSYRMDEVAADLATVDLNSCLYKIECDIASTIRAHFNDRLVLPAQFSGEDMSSDIIETSGQWFRLAKKRRHTMNTYMWEENAGMYFDYNTAKQEQTTFESVTTLWTLWAGVATPAQATSMVVKALPKFEMLGGLVSGTERSRGAVGIDRPFRQWDYPFGWAPHQILAWTGLLRYSYQEEAQRLAYKWLLMITKTFANFNGVIVEKYDVTQYSHPHNVAAEYGNQGADFKGVPREGYIIGLGVVDLHMQRALGVLAEWNDFQRAMQHPST